MKSLVQRHTVAEGGPGGWSGWPGSRTCTRPSLAHGASSRTSHLMVSLQTHQCYPPGGGSCPPLSSCREGEGGHSHGVVPITGCTARRAPPRACLAVHTGTYLIPGASSRLVRPVQLICRCCRGRGRPLGWKEPEAQAENPLPRALPPPPPPWRIQPTGGRCPLRGARRVRAPPSPAQDQGCQEGCFCRDHRSGPRARPQASLASEGSELQPPRCDLSHFSRLFPGLGESRVKHLRPP